MYHAGIVVLNTSKIQFKSNSQPHALPLETAFSCAQYFKDTIQKQFTTSSEFIRLMYSCAQYFKDTIQKQFTTTNLIDLFRQELCSILQRYNSKAIHNTEIGFKFKCAVVLNTSKIQFKSNSQRCLKCQECTNRCAQYFKDTIQKQFTTACCGAVCISSLCSILQRYNSKAIHNRLLIELKFLLVVLNTSKIQFKSNSQLTQVLYNKQGGCAQYFKDTIQKQFTTLLVLLALLTELCSILQRYNSKAIHN